MIPPKLQPGQRVRLVSPASTPTRASVGASVAVLERLGLIAEIGDHVFDEFGYLAGTDADRLADVNDALRDPGVRAVIATRGGKGAYRIADGLDVDAARADPKLVIGFSEITILQLKLLKDAGLACLHGAPWGAEVFGDVSARSFEKAVFSTDPITVAVSETEHTRELTTGGVVHGQLIGGNQDSITTAAGWALPGLDGAILMIEAYNARLGQLDRQLTMLTNSGALRGVRGVAVGQYTQCGPDAETRGDWTEIDVLRDRLARLGVPILGGLPIGHGASPIAVPIGTMATLDADAGTLTVEPCVR